MIEIQTEVADIAQNVQNSAFSEAILGFDPGGIGTQLSQLDTLFKNNRWYMASNMRQLLSQLYVEHGIIQTIINVPVEDALRGGIKFSSKQLGEEALRKLEIAFDRENLLDEVIGQSQKWNRLFGGAGIIIITDQDPYEPLDMNALGPNTPYEFRAVDMWELFWDKQGTEGFDPTTSDHEFQHYTYYGVKLHKSRVRKITGITAPSFIRPRLRGWGFSIVEHLTRSLNQYLKAQNLAFEVLDEFKIDVYKLDNLAASFGSAGGKEKVQKRIQDMNQMKNYLSAVVLDAKDDFVQKELSFTGIAETWAGIRMQIASDMRMPLTKVFGISASGFNSGEDDLEVYNGMIESQVRSKCKYDALWVAEILCQIMFGTVPDDLAVEFKPLRVMSSEQEENVKTQKYNRIHQALTAGIISPENYAEACNKDNLLGVTIEAPAELPLLDAEDSAEEGPGYEGATRSIGATANPPPAKEAPEPKSVKNSYEKVLATIFPKR